MRMEITLTWRERVRAHVDWCGLEGVRNIVRLAPSEEGQHEGRTAHELLQRPPSPIRGEEAAGPVGRA